MAIETTDDEIVIDPLQEEINEKAEQLLNEGLVLEYADNYLSNFIVNEEANRKVLYLALLNKNQILIRGDASQGKTHLAKNVLLTIPKSRYDSAAGFSEASPKYYFETLGENIDIIFVPEFEGRPEQSHAFRFSSTDDGGGRFIVSEYDQEEKRWMPRIIETGVKTIISTSTHVDIDMQDVSRSWVLYPDPSTTQTQGICEKQANDFCNADLLEDHFFEQHVLWKIYEDLRKKDFVVVTPFYQVGKIITMPFDSWFMRRENPRIINLIMNIARINYRKRVTYTLHQNVNGEWKDVHYLIADLEDIHQALYLLNLINAGVSTGLSPTQNKMLELIAEITSEGNSAFEDRVGSMDVLKAMQEKGWAIESQDYANELLRGLFKKGFLFQEEDPNDRRKNLYSLTKKRRDFVKINISELEKCFKEWLEARPEEAFDQITSNNIYPSLLGNSAFSKEAFSESLLVKETDIKPQLPSFKNLGENSLLGNSEQKASSEEKTSLESLGNNKPTKNVFSEKKEGEGIEKNYRVASEGGIYSVLMDLFSQIEHQRQYVELNTFIEEAKKQKITRSAVETFLKESFKDGLIFRATKLGENYYKKVG